MRKLIAIGLMILSSFYSHKISAQVVADFSVETECGSLQARFKNKSSLASSFLWYFDPGFSSQINPTHTFSGFGTYSITLIAYGSGGASDTVIKNVTVFPKPFFTVSPDPNPICFGQTAFISVEKKGHYRYAWSPSLGLNDSTLAAPVASPLTSRRYLCTVTDTNSMCSETASVMVRVISCNPPKAIWAYEPTICGSFQVTFRNQSKNHTTSQWNFGDPASGADNFSTSNSNTVQHLFSGPGTFQVKLVVVDSSGFFTDSLIQDVVVGDLVKAELSLKDTSICPGDSVFVSTINPGQTTEWLNPDGRGKLFQAAIYLKPDVTTQYKVVVSANGCADTAYVKIQVRNFPVFTIIGDSVCFKETSKYSIFPGTGGVSGTFLWDFGDGNTSTSPAPSHLYSSPGLYNVTLTFTSSAGCDTSISRLFRVHELPMAQFEFSPGELNIENPRVRFFARGDTSYRYVWDFGDGFKSNEQITIHDYLDTGIYKVTLVCYNERRCTDTVIRNIVVRPRLSLLIPTAFSPNRNGPKENEVYRIFCNDRFPEFEFCIYNRFGQKIFETQDQDFIWDARWKEQDVPAGYYVYRMYYRINSSKGANQMGTIMVIR